MNAFLKHQNLKLPLPKNRSRNFFTWQKGIVAVVVLGVCLVFLNIFQASIKNAFYYATAPVSKLFWQSGNNVNSFFTPLFGAKGLAQENDNLKQENQNLLAQISTLQETIKGDSAIKEVILNTQADNFKLVLVQTISLDAASDTILINKGAQDGMQENMPVISSTKVLYGKVVKVYKNFSQVALISKKDSAVDIKIQQVDVTLPPIYGAVKGSGNLSVYLDLVSSGAQINAGDTLITSGLEGVFPKDLLIGKISSIDKNDLKPFQTAKIQPLFDTKNINNLFVITNYLK